MQHSQGLKFSQNQQIILLYYIKTFIIKNFLHTFIKKFFFLHNINIINLSLDELKLTAKNRNIEGYKNKSEEDLIKIFNESK